MQKHYNYLDIDLDSKIYRKLNAVQGDIKSRYILVNLYSNNLSYDLTSCTVRIYGLKKDKTIFFNNASVIDAKKGQFEIELTNQALAISGELKIQILVMGTNGERLTSSAFLINVGESIVDEDAIESSNEFGALTESLAKVDEWDEYFEETSGKIEEKYTERLNQHDEQFNQIEQDFNSQLAYTMEQLPLKVDKVEGMGLSTNNYTNEDRAEVLKVSNKVDKTYVDAITGAIASGSPKGVYNTLAELQTAFPTGATGTYLVRANSCFYYWNGTEWSVGWEYLIDTTGALKKITANLSNLDNVDNVLGLGIYYATSSSLPTNLPIQETGVLMVVRQTGDAYNFGITQTFMSYSGTYYRYRQSGGFSAWKKTATTDVTDALKLELKRDGIFRKDNLTNVDDLNNVTTMGMYYLSSSSLPLNTPKNETGVLVVTKPTADSFTFGVIQTFICASATYYRYRGSTSFSEWKKYITDVPIGGYDFTITTDAINKTFRSWVLKGDLVNNSFGTTHKKGDTIKTIPYMSRFNKGRDILYNTTLSTFYSMVENAASDLYLSGDYGYYGAVCSTLSGYLCSQDIYYTSAELFDVLDIYEYQSGASLRIGDNMLKEGHSRIITDILIDDTGKVTKVGVAEAGGPLLYYKMYTITEFENILKVNGGEYILGRFPNYKAKELEKIEFPTDCIPSRGHKGIYKTNETIKLYIQSGATTLYYKKLGGEYTSIPISNLPGEIVNGVNVYDITLLINDYDTWCVTTNPSNKPSLIFKCETGDVTLNGNSFTVSGYSKDVKPLWYQVIDLKVSNIESYYPSPSGYIANLQDGNKHYVDSDGTTSFEVNNNPVGYYVRVMYQTPYGQVFKDSEYVFL